MKVKIIDYTNTGEDLEYITYEVSGLDKNSLTYLHEQLDEKSELNDDSLTLTMYYSKEFYPLGSDEAKLKMEDYILREEIEMTVFVSGFLEDKND